MTTRAAQPASTATVTAALDPSAASAAHDHAGPGVRTGWRIIAFSSIVMTMTVFGQTAGVSVFVDPLVRDLNLTRGEVSTAYSVATLLASFLLPWVGRQIDRHGVRRVVLVIAAVFGAVVAGLSFAPALPFLAVGFFGIRLLGQGSLSLAAKSIIALRFRAGLGRAVGVSGALSSIGMSVMPLVLAASIGVVGWRTTWLVGGISIWLVVIPVTLWLLGREDRTIADEPRMAGAGPLGVAGEVWTSARILRSPVFWLITLTISAVAGIGTGLTFHQVSILGEAGLSPELAAANFLPQTVTAVATMAVVSPLAMRWTPRWMLVACLAVQAAVLLLLPVLTEAWALLAYPLMIGVTMGLMQAIDGTLYPRYFGRRAIGTIRGLAYTMIAATSAIGPIILGVAYDLTGTYVVAGLALITVPVVLAAAALLMPAARRAPAQA